MNTDETSNKQQTAQLGIGAVSGSIKFIKMKRGFIKDCLFFQSKELLHKFLGVFVWLNILQMCLVIINLWSKYCH